MAEFTMNTPDDLDDLLAPREVPADSRLRDRLREKTVRQLRPRWKLGAIAAVAALGVFYATGAGTVWLLRPIPAPVIVEAPQPPPPTAEPERSPQQLELAAEQIDGDESAKLYLAAARKFGRDFGDWDAALRCYRNALDAAPEIQATIDPENDDWLMTALKLSRKEEIRHANVDD